MSIHPVHRAVGFVLGKGDIVSINNKVGLVLRGSIEYEVYLLRSSNA